MKNILIPTDFTVDSLQLIEYAILNHPDSKLNIILAYGYKLPENVMNMLTFSPLHLRNTLIDESFANAKRDLILDHRNTIHNICIEVFTGTNGVCFKDFVREHHIDGAIVPGTDYFCYEQARCYDLSPYIRKHISEVREVGLERKERELQRNRYSFLRFLQQYG